MADVMRAARPMRVVDGQVVEDEDTSEYQYWTTKEGQRLLISDMENTHLWNALRKLEQDGKAHPKRGALIEEAARRGLCLKTKPSVMKMRSATMLLRRRTRSAQRQV